MKNIIVCSAIYATEATGGIHFARFVRDLNGLTDSYRVFLLTNDVKKDASKQIDDPDPSTLLTFSYYCPPRLFFLGHFIYNWLFYRAIQRFRRQYPLEAVVFNQDFLGVLSRWLLPKSIKIIGIVHDDQSLIAAHGAYASRKAFWYQQFIQRPLERYALRYFDVVIANSEYVQQLIARQYPSKIPNLIRLYQSIDVNQIDFLPPNWQITEGGIVKVLFVKWNYVRGGLEDLIQALGALSCYQFELTVVNSPHQQQAFLEKWGHAFPNISMTMKGHQNAKAVSELMRTHHILCVPARHEALGLANAEGLAHGILVVSTSVGGIPEVLDNGACGWLAPPQNPAALAEALKNCIETPPSVRKAKSEHGRYHVEKWFSKEKMLTDLLTIFDKVIGKN